MGSFCSKVSAVDRTPSEITLHNGIGDHYVVSESRLEGHRNYKTMPLNESVEKPFYEDQLLLSGHGSFGSFDSFLGESKLSRASSPKSKSSASKTAASGKNGSNKAAEMGLLLGRASTAGLGKAVEVLDTLGSSMTGLNSGSGFGSGITTKGNKISILAFEVANTIVKGANLMQSLSTENVKHLHEKVLQSEGVQHLISKDIGELRRIAASDKREELKVFSGEVIRFGNRCKDPQWHCLERYFNKLEADFSPQPQLKETAPEVMKHLMSLVGHTAELYHEMHALDRFQQDYKQKLQEENWLPAQRGENLQILRQELKSQRRHVKSLKKKSLWSKILEEVTANLVDIVHFLHLEIHDAFGVYDVVNPAQEISNNKRLGPAGLALHYANVINQIDTIVSRSSSVPPNMRDSLYQGLPLSIKSALRSKLQSFHMEEQMTVPQIKAAMEKTLQWLVPVANNTTRAHHGFGWVGEWANIGTELHRKAAGQTDVVKLQTLYHADNEKADSCILDLVLWLNHLISQHRPSNVGVRSPIKSPARSLMQNKSPGSLPTKKPLTSSSKLSEEDREMLRAVTSRKPTPGISKSQELGTGRLRSVKYERLSKSSHQSPTSEYTNEFALMRWQSVSPTIDFDNGRIKVLEVIDRVDSLMKL